MAYFYRVLVIAFLCIQILLLSFLIFLVNTGVSLNSKAPGAYIAWAYPTFQTFAEKYADPHVLTRLEKSLSQLNEYCLSPSYLRLGTSKELNIFDNYQTKAIATQAPLDLSHYAWTLRALGIERESCSKNLEDQWNKIRNNLYEKPFLMELSIRNDSDAREEKKLFTGPCNGISAVFLNHNLLSIRYGRLESTEPLSVSFAPYETKTLGLLLISHDSRTPGCVWPQWFTLIGANEGLPQVLLQEQKYYFTVERTGIFFFVISLVFFAIGIFRRQKGERYLLLSLGLAAIALYSVLGLHNSQDLSFGLLMSMRLLCGLSLYVALMLNIRSISKEIFFRRKTLRIANDLLLISLPIVFGAWYLNSSIFRVDENRYFIKSLILFLIGSLCIHIVLTSFIILKFSQYRRMLVPGLVGGGYSGLIASVMYHHYFSNQTPFLYSQSILVVGLSSAMIFVLFERYRESEVADLSSRLKSLSDQVVHDIRSPLAVLEMLTHGNHPNDENRILLRNGIDRIKGILKTLSNGDFGQKRPLLDNKTLFVTASMTLENINLAEVIDEIVTEKQLLSSKNGKKLFFEINQNNYTLFSRVQSTELKRVLSNVVNNAVEATRESEGFVEILLYENNVFNEILVRDNGKGIPIEILNCLGRRGFSFDKMHGSGLGLSHAFEMIKLWNGIITISSEVGFGTSVKIQIPKSEPPYNFPIFSNFSFIYIGELLNRPEFRSFSRLSEFRTYFSRHFADLEKTKFVFDVRLESDLMSTVSTIQELGIHSDSVILIDGLFFEKVKQIDSRISLMPRKIFIRLIDFL